MESEPNPVSDEELLSTDWDLVVLGRGLSAIVNCVTRLKQGTLPERTLLIGKPDPWLRYESHKMGQFPSLLRLPGFQGECLSSSSADDFVESKAFAKANQDEFEMLRAQSQIRECHGQVSEPLQRVKERWLLVIPRGEREIEIQAKRVDVCTGPGPGRVFSPGENRIPGAWADNIADSFDLTLRRELRSGLGRRVFVAERFMGATEVSGHVVVVGEGPLAACAVEHALAKGADDVVWIGRTPGMIETSFPPSCRYDGLIKDPTGVRRLNEQLVAALENGDPFDFSQVTAPMTPRDDRLTISLGCVGAVRETSVGVIPFGRDHCYHLTSGDVSEQAPDTHRSTPCDVLVISAASEDTAEEQGTAAHLLSKLPEWINGKALAGIKRFGMFSGLTDPIESLRVLGSASRVLSLLRQASVSEELHENYVDWHRSLCGQARMPYEAMGIPVGAATIAMANDYYSETYPDQCAQTALSLPADLLAQRRERPDPFSDAELRGLAFSASPRPS